MITLIKLPSTPPEKVEAQRTMQPLREVGSLVKTQFWHPDDIMAALRSARLQGIAPGQLYANRTKRQTGKPN